MDRARRVALAALFVACSLSSLAGIEAKSMPLAASLVAAVGWPVSSLLVSEVQTGGVSASDEFIELTNAGPATIDLAGLEVIYVTASGSTVTRKATWIDTRPIEPGRHFLLANVAGAFASIADATYSGGIASTGGAIALRPVGGSVVDAVGWGDATNAFVEGLAVAAPPAVSSIERRPGGAAGNGSDSNDNAADFFVQPMSWPQNLASVATPGPSATAVPSATTTPAATPSPTLATTAVPTATVTPTPAPTPTPGSTPTQPPRGIADVRGLANDSFAIVAATLTTALGALEGRRSAFVQDDTGGIALYLDAAASEPWPPGTTVIAEGTVDDRYGQRSLRVSDLAATGVTTIPNASAIRTGTAGETIEGSRVTVTGVTSGTPSVLADGTGLLVDDGSGQLRVIVSAAALGGLAVPSGTTVSATGPLGQRDSSGTGAGEYRLYATEPGEFQVLPSATPVATATATAPPTTTPTAAPSPSPTPTAVATSSPSPTPPPMVISIEDARTRPIGSAITVAGVITAEPGRLGIPNVAAIQDATAGIAVRLPESLSGSRRGMQIQLTGVVAEPYGQRELRSLTSVVALGDAPIPVALGIHRVGETVEGRLVTVSGTVVTTVTTSTSGDLAFDLDADGVTIRIVADASSGLARTAVVRRGSYRLTGVVGQHATGKGRLDGYRIWLRDSHDVQRLGAAATPTAPGGSSPPTEPTSIAKARLTHDRVVNVEGRVTAPATLLDATGRRVVVEDATAAIEVLLPSGTPAPAIGARLAVDGTVVRAYGAPRVRATAIRLLGSGAAPAPASLSGAPGSGSEWRLVRIVGVVDTVRRLGDRWRAELVVGRYRVPIAGLSGARIPSTALVEGHRASIVGIVRRAYPGATDRRFAIVPRSAADIDLGALVAQQRGAPGMPHGLTGGVSSAATANAALDVDIADLANHVGQRVRVGGLIVEVRPDGARLDDATAIGRVILAGSAAEYVTLLEQGDAVNATGIVERRGKDLVVVVSDAAGLARVGDLDPASSPFAESPAPASAPVTADAPAADRKIAATAGPFGSPGLPGAAGLASLVLLSVVSAVVTVLRRRHVRHRVMSAIGSRVATIRRREQPMDGQEPTGPPPM
jgi:lamin tail-like protein